MPSSTPYSPTSALARTLAFCHRQSSPLNAYNDTILRRPPYWRAQRMILRALHDPAVSTVVVPAGHSVGKSYLAAGVILGWVTLFRDSLVMSTSPSNTQLSGVLWKEIHRARNGSKIARRLGRVTKLPNKFDLGDGWMAMGFATNAAENMQGFHAGGGPLLNVIDEASGIHDPDRWATLKSLKPDKTLMISNPLWAYGHFYDTCRRAEDDPAVRLIRIPSTDSPDIGEEKSKRGLADAAWLREMEADYGSDSQMWRIRVAALFPDDSADALIPSAWLDRAAAARHAPFGPRRISVDLALGRGGDKTVIVVRDDNGFIHHESSNLWSIEATAPKVAGLCHRFGVDGHRVSFDFEGLGATFGGLLAQAGIPGARAYRGLTASKDPKFNNLRTAAHWLMRQRLNPAFRSADLTSPPPFAIPPDFLKPLRRELREITLGVDSRKRNAVRSGEEVRAALRHSPDHADALAQSFAFPNG